MWGVGVGPGHRRQGSCGMLSRGGQQPLKHAVPQVQTLEEGRKKCRAGEMIPTGMGQTGVGTRSGCPGPRFPNCPVRSSSPGAAKPRPTLAGDRGTQGPEQGS